MFNGISHRLQPSRGAVNFILAQLYVGVNTRERLFDSVGHFQAHFRKTGYDKVNRTPVLFESKKWSVT